LPKQFAIKHFARASQINTFPHVCRVTSAVDIQSRLLIRLRYNVARLSWKISMKVEHAGKWCGKRRDISKHFWPIDRILHFRWIFQYSSSAQCGC